MQYGFGPKWTITVNVLGDIIGATLFPTGAYFVGYTISAGVSGLIYGTLLYKKNMDSYKDKEFIIRVIIAVIAVAIIVNMILNTFWTSIITGSAFLVLFWARIVKQLIMIPIHIILIIFLEKILRNSFDKYIRSEND